MPENFANKNIDMKVKLIEHRTNDVILILERSSIDSLLVGHVLKIRSYDDHITKWEVKKIEHSIHLDKDDSKKYPEDLFLVDYHVNVYVEKKN